MVRVGVDGLEVSVGVCGMKVSVGEGEGGYVWCGGEVGEVGE